MSIKPSNITSSYLSAYTTQTLTYSDIISRSEYEVGATSMSGGYNVTNETPNFSASPPVKEEGEDITTTYATLTEGNINVGGTQSSAGELGIHTDIDTAHEKVEDLPDLKAILEEQQAMAAAANTVIETTAQVASDIALAADKKKTDAKAQAEKDALESDLAWEYFIALEKEDTVTQEAILREVNAEYNEASITLEHWGVGGDYSRALSVVTNIIVGATAGQGNAQIATNAIAPYASMLIGDTFDHTDDPNKAAQLLSHAVLGAIIAYMNGGDAVSGAASATASELASMVLAKELYPEAFDEEGNLVRSRLSEEQAQGIVAITNAIGALAGGITGGDSYDASIGSFIGENAVVNNRMLAGKELEFINDKAFLWAMQKGISEEEARKQLLIAALLYNMSGAPLIGGYGDGRTHIDEETNTVDPFALNEPLSYSLLASAGDSGNYTEDEIAEAYSFLLDISEGDTIFLRPNMFSASTDYMYQPMFTSTPEQFADDSFNPDGDPLSGQTYPVYPVLEIFTLRGGTLITEGGLITTSRAYTYATPYVRSGYYSTMNFVYDPRTVLIGTDIFIGAVDPNIPTNFWQDVGYGINEYIISPLSEE